jgi:argininosuccinate lyase
VARARAERDVILPSYTHRQRAQPISLAYWLLSYAAAFQRDAQAFQVALEQADVLALGVGAISGSSLGIDRDVTRKLLAFPRMTLNGLDTVGDRDFALDYLYATSRFFVHASRLSTDFIDFTTQEFGFATLSGDIACGSSMKNPDVFELVRGKSGRAVGNLVGLLTTLKGLPGGYNRDLQEDRASLLETSPLFFGSLSILRLSLPRVTFDPARCRVGVDEGFTQATDLAEALVKKGLPFRKAYQAVGSLVKQCQERGLTLRQATPERAMAIEPMMDAEVLKALEPDAAVARKKSEGGTGPSSIEKQLVTLAEQADALQKAAAKTPRLTTLFQSLKEAEL